MIKLLVVDDQQIVRAGLCRILELEKDIELVGETGSGREAVEMCRKLAPDVMLLDLELEDIDGIDVIRRVKSAGLEVRILVLTMYAHEEYAVRVLEAGGDGFAVKGISQKQLPKAIRKVAEGGRFISQSVMEKTFMRQQGLGGNSQLESLSEREVQVLRRLANGESAASIADSLCISESSVRTYKARIMEKIELDNIADLVRFAMRNGLIHKL